MPVLPIPMIVALVLFFLLAHIIIQNEKPLIFAVLLGACGLQSAIIALNQYYGFHTLSFIQPVTAVCIPPLAFVTFVITAIRPFQIKKDMLHMLVPVFVAFCVQFAPQTLDVIVFLIFALYGGALLYRLSPGRDSLVLTRLGSGDRPLLIWRFIAIALLITAVSDAVIAVDLVFGSGNIQIWVIGVFSSCMLMLLGLLSLSQSLDAAADDIEIAQAPELIADEVDRLLIERLKTLVEQQKLFLDPELSLARLARRLTVPAKQLSAAINRIEKQNVSRYINGFRIRHACTQLSDGQNITEAMLASGFNTKSNFNREFLRVTGKAPSVWAAETKPENFSGS